MADEFGALSYPSVAVPVGPDDAVTDPMLFKLGSFLAAVLNVQLNAAWGARAGGVSFVKTIDTNDPSDSTFNERDLPALFVWRTQSLDDQLADDYLETMTDVIALWVPQSAVQANRSLRDGAFNGLQKGISRALNMGRDPAWVDPLDTDPESAERGSVLMERAGLFRMPFVTTCRRQPVTIKKGETQATYPAFVVTLKIAEVNHQDPSVRGAPSKLDSVQTAGSLVLETIKPKPTP